MSTVTTAPYGLYKRGTTRRDDMRNHPEIAAHKPHPVGIAGSMVEQFNGTNIFQWWVHCRDARWRPHGPLVMIDEETPNASFSGAGTASAASDS